MAAVVARRGLLWGQGIGWDSILFALCSSVDYTTRIFWNDPMPVHTLPLKERHPDRSTSGASRWPKFTPEEAAELREKGFRFSICRPEEDEFRLSLPLQTIEDREHGTITIEQG
mgnify:CR=1 FL=1